MERFRKICDFVLYLKWICESEIQRNRQWSRFVCGALKRQHNGGKIGGCQCEHPLLLRFQGAPLPKSARTRAETLTVKLPTHSSSPQKPPSLFSRASSVTWGWAHEGFSTLWASVLYLGSSRKGNMTREDRAELSTRATEPALACRGAKCSGGAYIVPP